MEPNRMQVDRHKLKAAREAAGLKQEDVADAMSVTKAQVHNIEAGYSGITGDGIGEWAKACGVKNVYDLYSVAPPNAFRVNYKTPKATV